MDPKILRRLLIDVRSERERMHKTPKAIARSLRAFKNAHRLGLIRGVRFCRDLTAARQCERSGTPNTWVAQCLAYHYLKARAIFANASTLREAVISFNDLWVQVSGLSNRNINARSKLIILSAFDAVDGSPTGTRVP